MNQKSLGNRIRTERKHCHLTQEQLAELVNVSTTYIGLVERGERSVTLNKLSAIATTLHVSIDYLMQDSVPLDSSARSQRLMQLWSSASPKQQDLILNLVTLFLNNDTK